jgi:hypothetical protein
VFLLREPSDEAVGRYLALQAKLPFSYEGIGTTQDGGSPKGYVVDRYR